MSLVIKTLDPVNGAMVIDDSSYDTLDAAIEGIASMGWEEAPEVLLTIAWVIYDQHETQVLATGYYVPGSREWPALVLGRRMFVRVPHGKSYRAEETYVR